MAEGLGQRYGAPRRRAGERLHTVHTYTCIHTYIHTYEEHTLHVWQEITRDESRAGAVDALLAQLEFALSEAAAEADLTSLLGSVGSASVAAGAEHAARESGQEVPLLIQ